MFFVGFRVLRVWIDVVVLAVSRPKVGLVRRTKGGAVITAA